MCGKKRQAYVSRKERLAPGEKALAEGKKKDMKLDLRQKGDLKTKNPKDTFPKKLTPTSPFKKHNPT